MDQLVLVKHSLSEPRVGMPAEEWHLSAEGRSRCKSLAQRLAAFQPFRLFSSREPKAMETAAVVSRHLGVRSVSIENLHEHERSSVGLLSKKRFENAVKALFERPDDRVFGEETATQARTRFRTALQSLLLGPPSGNVVVVSHGTVISLFVAESAGVDAYDLWRKLELPSYVVLSLPELQLIEVVRSMATV